MPRIDVNSLLSSAVKLGVGAVIGVWLVYKLTGSFDTRLTAAEAKMDVVAHKLDEHNAAMEAEAAERRAGDRVTRALLRGICYGTSGDIPQARALCDVQER